MLWPDWGLSPVALGDRAGWGCSSTVGTPPPQWGSVPHGGAVDRGSPWGQVQCGWEPFSFLLGPGTIPRGPRGWQSSFGLGGLA